VLQVRVTSAGLAALDKARGSMSRSGYIRHLLAQDAKRTGKA
jgi:hypothetical protein